MTTVSNASEQKLNMEAIAGSEFTWINIENPTRRETDYLAKHYPFHPYDLDDCLSRTQRPKIDEYKDYVFVILHFQVFDKKTRVSTHTQLSIFIGPDYLITLHSGQLKPLVQLFHNCQNDKELCREHFAHGPGYLLYRIIDRLVDAYFRVLDKILAMVEDTEDKVFDEDVEAAKELAVLRRDLITQRRITWTMRTIIPGLEVKLKRFTKLDMNVYYGDLTDHVNKIWDTLEEIKEMIDVYKDTDFVLSNNRLNRIMRTLTIISTIMLPLIVISGLWSMNIPLPFGADPGGEHYFFYIMVTILVVVVSAMLYVFHRKRWI